ncbi:hypothetical protein BDB00DRAFT_33520 [Zychaea mexicana]|uniref:uncharacterized protein n=1 Tax=Zychaea mexicana TaxID=64656 RepID=UPI0022FDC71C|nr:uncharacterized protein BDB00DRAFT_33520 [Zychaea mexicana]KAI9488634.1 hypothetical protein BDB00DRAFT_33520 [Zychaea mexicana]
MTNYMEEIVENGSSKSALEVTSLSFAQKTHPHLKHISFSFDLANQKVSSCTPTTTATTTTTTTTTDARPHSASMDYNQQLQKDDKPTATTTADARPHSVSVNHVQQPQKDGVVYAELRWSIKEGSGSNNSNIPDIKRNSAPHNGDSSVEYDELSKSKRLAISEQSESSSSSSLVFTAGSSCFGESGGSKSLGDADNKKRKRRQNSSSSLSRKSSLAFILQQNQADSYP